MSTMTDFARARELMVEQQVRPWDVLDAGVLEVLSTLPREAFVPEAWRALAYADLQLPLGHGEVMLKPIVEGRALQALALQPGDEVLEVGTGSGWSGGRLFVVRGNAPAMEAVLVTRTGAGVNDVRTESLFETDLPYLAGAAPAPSFDW